MSYRWLAPLAVLLAIHLIAVSPRAQVPSAGKGPAATKPAGSDVELVEKLIVLRRDYQRTLEQLRQVYIRAGDLERSHFVEEELLGYHRIPKHALILDLDVPPPTLNGNQNVPEANTLLLEARKWKAQGGLKSADFYDNQRRAELLLQELLGKYPQSDKISDAAYMLGEIYEGKAYKQYRRAARYYERCFQWDHNTQHDARLRAARLYDVQIKDRGRAIELYREITTHEADPKRHQEATKRLQELMSPSR